MVTHWVSVNASMLALVPPNRDPVPDDPTVDSDATPYFEYFGRNAGPAGKGFYSFDLGGWHIVSLNSMAGVKQVEAAVGKCDTQALGAATLQDRQQFAKAEHFARGAMMGQPQRHRQFGAGYHRRALLADFQPGRDVGQLCRLLNRSA